MKSILRIADFALAAVISGLMCASASAQMYRCGSAYQDRPCDSGQGKIVSNKGTSTENPSAATSAPSKTAANPVCTQRGADAQKIVWEREAGATEEKQLEPETNPEKRKLITSVYRVRGTVGVVRARIEAECAVEMEEKAKAIALHQSMVKAGVLPGAPATAAPSAADQRAAADRQAQLSAQQAAEEKQTR